MNEVIIVLGEDKNSDSFYAILANSRTIYTGETRLEALRSLLDKATMTVSDVKEKPGDD